MTNADPPETATPEPEFNPFAECATLIMEFLARHSLKMKPAQAQRLWGYVAGMQDEASATPSAPEPIKQSGAKRRAGKSRLPRGLFRVVRELVGRVGEIHDSEVYQRLVDENLIAPDKITASHVNTALKSDSKTFEHTVRNTWKLRRQKANGGKPDSEQPQPQA